MAKYLIEFIGTFFLVATIGFCVVPPNNAPADLAPLAIGAALMVMVFAGGHISGGHYNPAVTLSVFLRGKCPASDLIPYWVAQALAAVAAAFTVLYVKEAPAATVMTLDVTKTLIVESLYTFALCFVVLNVATARGTAKNSFYGLAIGFTVLTGAVAVGAVSGGAFNPAVALGLGTLKLVAWNQIWLYLVSGAIGAVIAALVFNFTNPPEEPENPVAPRKEGR